MSNANDDTAAFQSLPPSPAALRQFHHYEVCVRDDGTTFHELGRGAMGISYKARDVNLDVPVALKVITAPLSGQPFARERFRREARAAAQLRHPNAASVFHFGETPCGQCFYAMEFIEGETLQARVQRDGPLPAALVLEIALQVNAALIAADACGIVHRDLKPANLMLAARRGGTDFAGGGSPPHHTLVKVIDFGLAKAVAAADAPEESPPSLTQGDFLGTPNYASPEQFGGGEVNTRSDIYSLGATLWYLLTAQVPFPGRSLSEMHDRRLHRPLPTEQLTAAGVPSSFAGLLQSMLAADPARRPASPLALEKMLEDCRETTGFLKNDSPSGGAAPTSIALVATPRRARTLTWVVVSVAVILAGVWGFASFRHANPPGGTGSGGTIVFPPAPEKSVAILPFANFSEDKDNAFFADGVQDEILTDLAKVADLKVISRTSVVQYKGEASYNLREIGRALGVAHIVEGSVQRAGNRIRVTAQLIDARTDAHQWAEHYDRDLQDIFAIQSEIAQNIAGQLQAIISPREHAAMEEAPTNNLPAYEFYLRAHQNWNDFNHPEDDRTYYQSVLGLLAEATSRDPGFARAFAFMAEVQSLVYRDFETTPAQDDAVRNLAETVARLRPQSGDAHMAMGLYYYQVRRVYPPAREEFAEAVRLLPNNARALFYLGLTDRRQGLWADALAHVHKASTVDPEDTDIASEEVEILENQRRYPEAVAVLDRWIAVHPQAYWVHLIKAEILLAWKADPRMAKAELTLLPAGYDPRGWATDKRLECDCLERDFAAAERDLASCPSAEINGLPRVYFQGCNARRRGDQTAATAAFTAARASLESKVRARPADARLLMYLAMADAGLGRKEDALAEARRGAAMQPLALDAHGGARMALLLARVLVWTGEPDEAIRTLQALGAQPSGPNYGSLCLDPGWDPLRGDPRFQALVLSLRPAK